MTADAVVVENEGELVVRVAGEVEVEIDSVEGHPEGSDVDRESRESILMLAKKSFLLSVKDSKDKEVFFLGLLILKCLSICLFWSSTTSMLTQEVSLESQVSLCLSLRLSLFLFKNLVDKRVTRLSSLDVWRDACSQDSCSEVVGHARVL